MPSYMIALLNFVISPGTSESCCILAYIALFSTALNIA